MLRDLPVHLRVPELVRPGAGHRKLPEIRDVVGFRGALEALQLGEIGLLLLRIKGRGRARAKLVARLQHPGLPGAEQRINGVGAVPVARPHGHLASPLGVQSIALGALDGECGHLPPQLEPRRHVAGVVHSSEELRAPGLRGHVGEPLGIIGEQVRQHG